LIFQGNMGPMIKGFRGMSLVDFPGRLAAVVFFGGCNFRCPFCYNVDLVLPQRLSQLEDIPSERIIEELKARENFISGVVITGGEPTLQKNLLRVLLEEIRSETSLAIKLDTNGSQPGVIESLLEENLLDYVALDFKTSPSRYPELKGHFQPLEETLSVLRTSQIPFEIRITAVPYFISQRELEELIPYFDGACLVALQRFMNEYDRLAPEMELGLYGPEELKELASFLKEKISPPVELRNV